PQMLFEMLLVRFALLDRTIQLEEVLRGLGDGGGASPSGRAAAMPAERSAPPARSPRARDAAPSSAESAPRRAAPQAPPVAPPPLADAPERPTATEPLDINRLAERWDD